MKEMSQKVDSHRGFGEMLMLPPEKEQENEQCIHQWHSRLLCECEAS
jgi:hypothetical protein